MSSNRDFDREVTFEIVEEIGVIATHSTGWKKELNLVSWNGGQAKYDIRDWDPGHSRMSRGVTLKEQEMRQIVELLRRRRPHGRDRESWWIRQWIRQRALQKLRLHRYQMGRARQCRRQTCRVRKHSSLGRSLCRDLCGKRRSRRKCRDPNRCRTRKRWQHPGKRMTTFLFRRFRI